MQSSLMEATRLMSAASGSGLSFDLSFILEWSKIIIPALGAWLAAYLTSRRDNRKDQREWESRQQDQLTAGWSEMTSQSREIIARLQNEIVAMGTRASIAEERAVKIEKEHERETALLKQELEELKIAFEEVKKELEAARRRSTRKGE